jgi:hypothetical protein
LKNKSDPSHELSSYFKLLPKYGFKNFPIFYTKKKIDMLNNTLFLGTLAKDRRILNEAYNKIRDEYKDNLSFEEEDFLKNYYTVNSRNVYFDNIKKKALVPIGDLINFNPYNINCQLAYNKDKNAVEIVATQDIPAGEEITVDYGFKPNKDYLLNYGFTIAKPNDLKVEVELDNKEKITLSRANYDVYNNSIRLAKKSKDPIHNLIKLAKILGGTILNYNDSLDDNQRKLRRIEEIPKREIDVLRILEEEKEIFYEGFDVVNAIFHFLKNSKKDEKLKKLEYISQELLDVAEKNEEKIKKELKTHKIKVLPVVNYEIYKRPDFAEFLKSLNK